MLLNYLKITLRVLGRNRFFTFVSLFGIVFTLVILIVLSSFLDHLLGAHYPDVNRGRSLYIGKIACSNLDNTSNRIGPPSFHFLNKYVAPLKSVQTLAISSLPSSANTYVNGRRLKLNLNFTNAEFWEVTAFKFLEGKAYNRQHIDNGDYVAVISESTRNDYFGSQVSAVGKTIEIENVGYRVIGVVKDVPITRIIVAGDVYLPYHVSKSQAAGTGVNGNFYGILLANSPADFPAIREEYQRAVASLPLPMEDRGFRFEKIETEAETYLESFLSIGILPIDSPATFYAVVAVFMLLFMLLPAINLVNLNLSRIMERASEIGLRKAFGATTSELVVQLLVENIFITCIGGVIALALSAVALHIFNDSGLIPDADLTINATVALLGLAACLVFGLMSGLIPALRMSRMHVVEALRGGDQNH